MWRWCRRAWSAAVFAAVASLGACYDLSGYTDGATGAPDAAVEGGADAAPVDGAPADAGADGGPPDAAMCPPYVIPSSCDPSYLTDDHNCCVAGRDCHGAACVAGKCTADVLVGDATSDARGIAVAGPNLLVWATGCTGQLRTISKTGAGNIGLPPGPKCTPTVAVQGANVFWIEYDGPHLNSTALDGSGAARIVATAPTTNARSDFARLAVDATNAYWADSSPAAIWWAPLAADAATPKALASESSLSLVKEQVTSPYGVAVDSSYVYWSDTGGDAIKRRALSDLTSDLFADVVVTGESGPRDIALDALRVYWLTSGGLVRSRVKNAADPPVTLASGQTAAESIVVDDQYVYWTNYVSGGNVSRVPKAGGAVEVLASGQAYPYGLAQDCTSIYFTNQNDFNTGQVVRIAK